MKYTFDPKRRLIIVVANIFGPRGETAIKMALDTGASQTQIIPTTLEDLGYSLTDKSSRIQLNTAGGVVERFKMNLFKLSAIGKTRTNLSVIVGELPPNCGVQGLLGLDHFHDSVLSINFRFGRMKVNKASRWFW